MAQEVVSYVAKREQPVWRQRLQRAYNRPDDEALAALQSLQHELEDPSGEGLDETLTLHRLGVYGVLGRSRRRTASSPSTRSLRSAVRRSHWQNSSPPTALHRAASTQGDDRHLPRLRDALKRELKIDHDDIEDESRVSNQESRRVSTRNGLDSRLRLTVRNGPLVQSRGNIDSERRSAIWRQFLADSDIRTVLALTS